MHFPPLISDLAFILGVAALVTLLFRKIRQPTVLGYILAGYIVGPHTPGPGVVDLESIKVWAELGVIFLMFALGLEFSLRKLVRVGPPAIIIGVFQIVCMLALGYLTASMMGWSHFDGLFLGSMIAISSTTIIIKAFEELRLTGQWFTRVVFGILIVEDLAAILILAGLTSFAGQQSLDPWALLWSATQLCLVVGTWFLFGMVLVPRFMLSIGKHGSDELVILASVALCLGLVSLATKFHYSVALGAFIMGSILAETRDVKRIEHLVLPLKDIFGAVFFISVGMLLDPNILVSEWSSIGVITAVILGGKMVSVFIGSLVAGQSVPDSSRISLSMAQIGEFSFIIATLGLALNVIRADLYPVIIAASVVTTFVTPYLMRLGNPLGAWLPRHLPTKFVAIHDRYSSWVERTAVKGSGQDGVSSSFARWIACAVLVTVVFYIGSKTLPEVIREVVSVSLGASRLIAWGAAFLICLPFIWAMLFGKAFDAGTVRVGRMRAGALSIMNVLATIGLLGILSREYMPLMNAVLFTVGALAVTLLALRDRIEIHYRWYENLFLSGFSGGHGEGHRTEQLSRGLAPWNAKLKEITIPADSRLCGKSLIELQIRERFGVNIICIERGSRVIVPPLPTERLMPGDRLLMFGDDREMQGFGVEVEAGIDERREAALEDLLSYKTSVFDVHESNGLVGLTIRASRIREDFRCIVVGLERGDERMRNPDSSIVIRAGDLLWLVGASEDLGRVGESLGAP